MENKQPTLRKKKVLYFVPEFPRLTETFIEREITKLLELDQMDIRILSLSPASGTMSELARRAVVYQRLTARIAISAFVKYLLFSPRRIIELFKLISGSDKEPLFLNLRAQNAHEDHSSIVGRFHKARIFYMLKGVAYAKIFSEYKPDHIHVHFLSSFSTIAMVAAHVLHIPFSISAHAKDAIVDNSLIATKAQYAKFIAICNKRTWQTVVDQIPLELKPKVKLIYHGIDHEKIFAGDSRLVKPQRPVIFMGGTRLVEKKGIKYVIEASKILKSRGVDHQVEIVGPGPLYKELQDQIHELGLSDNVFIHGEGKGTPFDQVVDYYKIADIFVFPSIETNEGDMDGVPTVVIEAALAKIPIIATSAGSITDLVEHNVTGIVIPQKDSHALADQIENLLHNHVVRESLVKHAFKKASEMFHLDTNVKQLQELLLS